MLRFYKTKEESGIDISVNPNYVTQIESYTGSETLSFIIMEGGKRYLVNENCFELTEKLEKLANRSGY